MSVDSLPAQLQNQFAAGPVSAAVATGLWLSELPEDLDLVATPGPFAVVYHLSEEPEYTTGRPYIEKSRVAFVMFGIGAAAVENAVALLKQTFDFCNLGKFGGAIALKMQRIGGQMGAEEIRNRDGQLVFSWQVDYEVWIQRNRTDI